MKKLSLTIFLITAFAAHHSLAQSSQLIRDYILTYKDAAMEEMKRSGVPASITLAQGIHETGAGQSWLVRKSNNHFGIKCKENWTGESVSHDDDARGECFRKYPSALESYRDHSDFLKTRRHYAFLFQLDPTDYEGWAYGLKKAGYATNPKYPQILIQLIKKYNLQDYTLIALGRMEDSSPVWASSTPAANETQTAIEIFRKDAYPAGVFRINDTKVVFVEKGASYLAIAEANDISLSRLFEFNDMKPQETADRNGLVYLQRKRQKGAAEFYTMQPGESLYDVAQKEGIRLENLLEYNHLTVQMEPQNGAQLSLHRRSQDRPALKTSPGAQVLASLENKIVTTIQNTALAADATVHIVQQKETLYSIAKKYGVTVEEIMKWNGLESSEVKQGHQLRINKNNNGY